MGATRNRSIVSVGLSRVLGQFRDSPKLQALAASYLEQVQTAENAVWDTIEAISIDGGPLFMLAAIGTIVGRGQKNYTIDQFRALIRAQIRINRSRGVAEDFLDVARLMVNDLPAGVIFQLIRAGTKVLQITQSGPFPTIGALALIEGFRGVKDDATRLHYVYPPSGTDHTFRFAPAGVASNAKGPASTDHGFAWSGDGTGGHFANEVLIP